VPIWMTMGEMYGGMACATLPMRLTRVAPIRKHQKNQNRMARLWFRWVISVWAVIAPLPGCEVVRQCLLAYLNKKRGSHPQRREVRGQRADQHVVLALDLADLRLPDSEVGGQLRLCQTSCSAYRGKVDHTSILL
jgi:hypothetical protein